jgi:Cof subfamily protein (haloacid dehalogenase superfamily)
MHPKKNTCKGLFITDFDGTLLRSDGTFSQRDLDALETLAQHGVKTAIATGRSLYSFNSSPGRELPVDYVIFSSGAGVISQPENKLLYKKNLSSEMVKYTLEFMQASSFDFMLHHAVPDNHRYVYRRLNGRNTDFETRINRYREFGTKLNSMSQKGFGEAAQFLAVIPPKETDDALKFARNGLPGLSVIRSTSPLDHKSTWIELFHPEVSKSKTAAWLASRLNLDAANIAAIGNDYNDQDLLEWAALSFVVKNAPEDLKSRFRQVASNNNGGVAEAVNCWLGRLNMIIPS